MTGGQGEGDWVQYSQCAIRWQILTSMKVIFTLALAISKILRFEMFDLKNLGQGHGHSQCCYSMANSTSIKLIIKNFSLAFPIFQILSLQIL